MSGELSEELIVENDFSLIKDFIKNIDEIEYIAKESKSFLTELKDNVSLNYQNDILLKLWKSLIGDAIVYLKNKDKREDIHDSMKLGLGDLYKYIEAYKEFEPMFYGGKINYRDHIEHIFRTFLLGDSVIRKTYGYENILPLHEDIIITKEEKEAMWCIISLCHDIGYPLQAIKDLNEPIRKILKAYGHSTSNEFSYTFYPPYWIISDFAIKFMSSKIIEIIKGKEYITHLQPKYYQKFLSAYAKFNHGVISSLLLMKDLVYFKESDYTLDEYKKLDDRDARQFLIRKEIIRAIASHSCNDIYYLKGNDFSFLLKIFDEMQEWERPRLIEILEREGGKKSLTINKFSDKKIVYTITFKSSAEYERRVTDEEKEIVKKDIESYFTTKCGEWLNVLRSAVGGDERDIELDFYVVDDIPPIKKTYSVKHPNPRDVLIEPEEIRKKILIEKTI